MLKKRVLENPQILGWLGILPFIFTSFFVLFEIRFSLELKVLGLLYASSILGFLGAVYWGYLLKSEAYEHILWAWGIATSLVAWFSLILIFLFNNYLLASLILSLGFIISLIVDYKNFSSYSWYVNLRLQLTCVAIICTLINGVF
jgi:hypothetical protein